MTIETDFITDVGMYTITLEGRLPRGAKKSTTFELEVKIPDNDPPYFTTALLNFTMSANSTVTYNVPAIKDD
jgi:hypothetical protein